MKKLLITLFILSLFVGQAMAQVSFGHAEKINNGWRFLRMDAAWNIKEQPDMKEKNYDDSQWRKVDLPHDWGVELPMSPDKGSCQGYLSGGLAWYRLHFNIENGKFKTQSSIFNVQSSMNIYFEGIYNYSEVYLNGKLLGKRPSGFASFMYDMTPYLENGENVIAVRVDHSQEFDSRWYTGSGIYRNVWMISAPQVHLAQWGTAYRLKSINAKKAEVEVDVETTNNAEFTMHNAELCATVELKDAGGRVVATTKTAIGPKEKKTVKLTVKNPQRWTLENPYLYTLITTLSPSGDSEGADTSIVRAGLRTLDFSPDKGFALNGKWMKVKGVCLHDDAGVLGTAVPAEVWHRRLLELKAIGVNAIRMSHNPHAPELYDLCDEVGLLVMDEASDEWELPKRKWMKGWNAGSPEHQGTYTYFEEWIDRDVADMVRRDRCHPSIFMWSIGNEVDYPNDPYSHPVLDGDGTGFTQPVYGGYKPDQPNAERIGVIAQRLAKIVKDIDPSRPTTGALAGVVMSNATAYPSAIDVVGYNYTESRYGTDHKTYPKRIIYGSENRHDLAAWEAVTDNEHIFGQFLWTGIDYLGESGRWSARGSSAGLLDLAGQRKPLGWYRASLWSEKPVCYIGTYRSHETNRTNRPDRPQHPTPNAPAVWNYDEGTKVHVVCYTNAKTARLLLNGKETGGEPQRDADTNILFWDIDYKSGTLRCEADNGAFYEITTAGRPYALKVTTDSIAHIFIEVVDEQGHLVPTADNEITLFVRGARLLGMENGNIGDTGINGRQQRNRLRTYQGRLVAYIQPTPGEQFTIRASSQNLSQRPTAKSQWPKSFTTETPMVHDPVMAKEGDTYYIYSTGRGIQQMTSKDRKTWTVLSQPVMTVIPSWTTDSVPGFESHVWAPDVIKWHGRWWMAYSCSTFGRNGSAIGLLSSRSLRSGMWKDEGCIVTSHDWKKNADGTTSGDNWNAIDPNFVIDDNDNPWLVWGSFWDGIQLSPLDSTMHLLNVPSSKFPRTIARRHRPGDPNAAENPTSRFAGRNAIEAPFIFKHDGWYYLFVAWDYCCRGAKSNYRVAVGRSRSVEGPYLDRDGKDMLNGGGTIFFEGDKKEWEAAGHCAAYTIDGEDIFICHGYSTTRNGAAFLIQRPITWTTDAWPKIK